MINNLLVDMLD